MHHVFRGRRYEFEFSNALPKDLDGDTDDPSIKGPHLRVRWGLNSKRSLEVTIHEALHACYWDLSEEAVTEGARDIAKFLTRLGYERREDGKT